MWNKIYLKKTFFEKFMKRGLKGGISIDADYGHLGYALWCCGSRSQDFLTFIQIGSGHTVLRYGVRGWMKNCLEPGRVNVIWCCGIFFLLFWLWPYCELSMCAIAAVKFLFHDHYQQHWAFVAKPKPERFFPKLNIQSTLNTDLIFWQPQWIVAVVEY